MTKENDFDVKGMYVELLLSSEQIKKKTIIPRLMHGSNVVVIQSGTENIEDCDALVTENHDLSLGIRTADCAPICFSDGKKIGIAHIGWRGLCLGLIEKMLVQFDSRPLSIYVGPFLHSFEIQKDFCYEQITKTFGERFIEGKGSKLIFNFKDAISSLLPPDVTFDTRNTAVDLTLPSYRRGSNDRLVTVVSFST